MKPWRRLATLRASRRRVTGIPLPPKDPEPTVSVPPLEPPDDDREFLPEPPRPVWDPRPAA